ncbi:uncharacterized protein LOC107610905 [Arachis ipaensis]|uniref:uncharacterized protein LOC107610905 n=1 Tax=Arachis ipaensis TaxID=130454 RepID=UPI0007AFCD01|nr:uncharacterized protein LOC107610905 [Arachis ipaensis]XP_025670150.1 uncharacterized protein LOC112769916 [Arachis hypogaea]
MVESERLKFFRCKQPQLRVDKYKCLHESLINGDVDAARLGKRIILPSTFTGRPRYAGYSSYFITMTFNPEWDEIEREVTLIGLKTKDRPDILCRVFKIKLDDLIDDLKEGKIFGKILGYVCTVEFQKRGLPHAHIILFMNNEFKPQTPDDIDKHITAEIPDENERPNLYGAVQNYMVHGPCGPYNKNSPCMKNGSCSKFYPKEFRQQTLIDEAGFLKYRRTDNGRTVKKRKCVLDNKFIVPYNPELLLKFGCHINVEYTCQTSSIKYLFKYSGVLEPFMIRLPFHLEDEQPVVYGETSNVNDIVERAISHKSIFLGWMTANMSYPYARSLTYAEFPTKFVWKEDSSKWFPRKKGFAIGRLTHVPAGSYVRRLFVILLTSNNISRPEHVWDRCWHELSDDILYRQRAVMNMRELTMSDDEIKQLCLIDIDNILHSYVDSSLLTERVIREELNFNRDNLKKNASDMGFFFVYGHGGTGKTFLWNLMSAEIRSRGDIVLNVASSGIASLLLPNGRTAHSRFKIPLNITEDFVCNIKSGSPQAMLLLKAKFIIWDEAPMVLKLTKNMRLSAGTTTSDQDEIEQFGEWLLKVGDGLIGDNMDGESEICLPGDIVIPSSDQTIVEEVNNHLMAIIPGGKKLYLSSDSICIDEGNMESQLDLYGPELLNSINCSGLPPHKLILKVGVPVMLLRNIDQSSGLCNGTRLQVTKLENHVIECEVLTGNNVGHIALIPRMNMVPTNETISFLHMANYMWHFQELRVREI